MQLMQKWQNKKLFAVTANMRRDTAPGRSLMAYSITRRTINSDVTARKKPFSVAVYWYVCKRVKTNFFYKLIFVRYPLTTRILQFQLLLPETQKRPFDRSRFYHNYLMCHSLCLHVHVQSFNDCKQHYFKYFLPACSYSEIGQWTHVIEFDLLSRVCLTSRQQLIGLSSWFIISIKEFRMN